MSRREPYRVRLFRAAADGLMLAGLVCLTACVALSGWTSEQIGAELGMEAEEVLRLKQITGLAALFSDRSYSEAWEPRKK